MSVSFKRCCLFFLCIFMIGILFLPQNVSASQNSISKKVCDNGLTILVRPMPGSPVVSLYAAVKTGSATEGDYLGSGLSHLLEHMLFKGTHDRGVGEIATRVQAMGGSINASTGKDVTTYKITLPVSGFDEALEILVDMLMNAVMDEEELLKEKDVVLNEMRLYADNPDRKISEIGSAVSYLLHPYRHPIIGYKDLFKSLTRTDVVTYYQEKYVANNMVFSVAGNVDPVEVMQKVEAAFSSYPYGKISVRNLPQEPQQITSRFHQEKYATDLARLEVSFPTVKLLDADLFALDVLAKLLGQGMSSRFYQDIYKKRNLVYQISAYNYTPIDQGRFVIRAVLEESKMDLALAAIKENLDYVKNGDISDQELKKARKQVLKEHVFSQQTAERNAYSQALDEIFAGDADFSNRYVEGISRVTRFDVERVAQQYLIDDAQSIVLLSAQKESNLKEEQVVGLVTDDVRRIVLDNGLTILIKENHQQPIVNMRLLINGGLRLETIENNGIFNLMSSLWTKGTKSYNAQRLSDYLETNGIEASGYSGRNSFGLTVSSLSQDKDKALAIFSEIARRPTFDQQELDKLKDQMTVALRLRDDNIFQLSQFHLNQTLFPTHPYGFDKIGTLESLQRMTRADIFDLYKHFVVADNMVLTVFGDFDADEFLKQVIDEFKSLKSGNVQIAVPEEVLIQEIREKNVYMDKEQAIVLFGFHGLKVDDPNRYGLELMTSLLGSSFSGRLFNVVREEFGQAYTLGGSMIPGVDRGMVYFYVLTQKQHVEHVQELVLQELKQLVQTPVSKDELDDMKVYLKGEHSAGLETISARSLSLGLNELYKIGYQEVDLYDQKIDALSSQDIQELARQYLNLNAYALVVVQSEDLLEQ